MDTVCKKQQKVTLFTGTYPSLGTHPPGHGHSWAAGSSLCPTEAAALYFPHYSVLLLVSSSAETTSSVTAWSNKVKYINA